MQYFEQMELHRFFAMSRDLYDDDALAYRRQPEPSGGPPLYRNFKAVILRTVIEESQEKMSRWYKTDLQIASIAGGFSMADGDISTTDNRKKAIEVFVGHIKAQGIEVFAVTDHNDMPMLEEIRDEAHRQDLVMFPGMELSTGSGADGIHLLLLGDPDADIQELKNKWYHAAGFNDDNPPFNPRGKHQPSHLSMTSILEALPEDTIAIAPHILSENGAGSGDSIKEASLKWRLLHHDRLEAVDVGIPSGREGWNDKFRARTLDNFPVVDRIAFVSTSDAYKPDGLGRHTWIRMDKPNLACLRQAFLDHGARIFCDWDKRLSGADPNDIKHSYIKSVRVEGASTSSTPLEVIFDPRITILIGSRGSGKSTVIQALRAVYGEEAGLPEVVQQESERYQSEVFKDATIESEFVEALSGASDTAEWTMQAGVETSAGNALINVRVVSQKELFERTSGDRAGSQSSSANMLTFVDEALEDDRVAAELTEKDVDITNAKIDAFQQSLEEIKRNYAQSASDRLASQRRLDGRKKIEESLAQVNRKLTALDDVDEKKKLDEANKTLADKRHIVHYAKQVKEWADNLESDEPPLIPTITTPKATAFFEPLKILSTRVTENTAAVVKDITDSIASTKALLETATNDFVKEVASAQTVKDDYSAMLAKLGVDISQYEALQVEKLGYEEALLDLDEIASGFEEEKKLESDDWEAIDDLFETRLQVRKTFTELISSRTPNLRFEVDPDADHSAWRLAIHNELGFRQGDHVDSLKSLAEWIWGLDHTPAQRLERQRQWRDALLSNDYDTITKPAGLSASFVARLSQASESSRIALASFRADDCFEMKFLKQGNDPKKAGSWQTVTDGSPGQRSAAMLAFTLSYGDSPLILDQPEDDLDSALVSALVVSQFRDARWTRQLIVVTHEANIPVNTDAERTVVLENADGELRIMSENGTPVTGPIDNESVRKQIQNLLEGGVIAFVNRERRYDNELSKYRNDVGLLSRRMLTNDEPTEP